MICSSSIVVVISNCVVRSFVHQSAAATGSWGDMSVPVTISYAFICLRVVVMCFFHTGQFPLWRIFLLGKHGIKGNGNVAVGSGVSTSRTGGGD